MKTETGGPAFPCRWTSYNDEVHLQYEGMSLRDYVAIKVMQGLLSAGRDAQYGDGGIGDLAKSSYSIADAMLKAGKS